MRPCVTQKHNFGCGAACIAFVLGKNYQEIISLLGKTKGAKEGFYCKELADTLQKFGLSYSYRYLKPKLRRKIYKDGVIVFVKRSKKYPAGHYLVRCRNLWMDPWANVRNNGDIRKAQSYYRKRLPGKPIYALFPNQ